MNRLGAHPLDKLSSPVVQDVDDALDYTHDANESESVEDGGDYYFAFTSSRARINPDSFRATRRPQNVG